MDIRGAMNGAKHDVFASYMGSDRWRWWNKRNTKCTESARVIQLYSQLGKINMPSMKNNSPLTKTRALFFFKTWHPPFQSGARYAVELGWRRWSGSLHSGLVRLCLDAFPEGLRVVRYDYGILDWSISWRCPCTACFWDECFIGEQATSCSFVTETFGGSGEVRLHPNIWHRLHATQPW